jgi:hypothetical protein
MRSSTRDAPNIGLLSGVMGPVESSQELSSEVVGGDEERKSIMKSVGGLVAAYTEGATGAIIKTRLLHDTTSKARSLR